MVPLPKLLLAALLITLTASLAPAKKDDEDPEFEGKKGSAWVDTLINDASARKRALAVEALMKLWSTKQYKHSIPTIGRALRVDSSVAVRSQAATALGTLKEDAIKNAVGDLVDALGSEKESRVRKEIALAVGRYATVAKLAITPLTAALKDADPGTRIAAADALALTGADGKSAAVGLVLLLQDPNKGVRLAAVMALGRISPEGAPAIAETMARMLGTEKDADIKTELAVSLGLLGEKSFAVVAALGKLLAEPDDELRRKVTRILGSFGVAANSTADDLLKIARSDKLKDIRADAVHAFGSALGADLKTRLKELLALLNDPEFEVRLAVVQEVGGLGAELKADEETIKILRGRMSDPHPKVREAAAAATKKLDKKADVKKEPEEEKQ
jgi:HEAT repeat protein